ncbi:MAG: hypothetical protein RR193_05310, partial [Christensenellaceae bacterium]
MSFNDKKIAQAEINSLHVQASADKFVGSAANGKAIFDALPEKIAEKYNLLVDEMAVSLYTKSETDGQINQKIIDIGTGDMAKGIYDTNNDGKVNAADSAESASNGIFLYTHSLTGAVHTLSGSGANGKFKAAASGTVAAFTVNGTACSVKQGEEAEIELVNGCWYTFILDGNTLNFKSGGAALNFKIVGGTTQPTNPSENTIWANTSIAIGDWQFMATQPTMRSDGTALQEGDLYINIVLSGGKELNVLKKNAITIYPFICFQYNNGAFIKKGIQIFKDNCWKEFVLEVFKNGVVSGYTFPYA